MHRISDDLKTIKGIAEAREEWLHKIGIHTIQDLAAAEAVILQTQLKKTGHKTPLVVIEDWISKARTHVTEPENPSPQKVAPSDNEGKIDADAAEWKTFAEFFVDYQHRPASDGGWERRTKIHRMRNGGKDIFFDGLAGEPAGRWMLEQLGEIEPPPPTQSIRPLLPPTQPARQKSLPQIAISLQGLEFIQSINEERSTKLDDTGRMFTQSVRSEEPFDLRIIFELSGEIDAHNGSIPCVSAQAYATNKSTGETLLLNENKRQPLLTGRIQQIVNLPKNQLLQGVYRLQVIVRALESPGTLGFLEVPFLWVT